MEPRPFLPSLETGMEDLRETLAVGAMSADGSLTWPKLLLRWGDGDLLDDNTEGGRE